MRTEIIAELATNWGGDLDHAVKLIKACAEAGADWVKFQSYQTKHLRPGDPQGPWFKQCELSDHGHHFLMDACQKSGVKFLTTVFTADRVPFLASLGLEAIKIGSGEAFDANLLRECFASFPRVILSAGLGTEEEMTVVGAEHDRAGNPPLTVCHSTSLYPTEMNYAMLGRLRRWAKTDTSAWNFHVGYSDHCRGIDVCRIAIAMGVRTLEKHISRPDSPRHCEWDATPEQLSELASWARLVEETSSDPDEAFETAISKSRDRFLGRWSSETAKEKPRRAFLVEGGEARH